MSAFKTIRQQNAEQAIDKMFAGLDGDVALKTVMRVLHGLEDEAVLDELRRVNEENLREIERRLIYTDASIPEDGRVVSSEDLAEKATDILNAKPTGKTDD